MNKSQKRKRLTPLEGLEAMRRYCAYQDRCHYEVRTRLIEHQIYGDDLEEILSELISENFLNEERFAQSYARGKFRMKGWGRNKIRMHLRRKYVSNYCIKKGLEEIDEESYFKTLTDILTKKHSSYGGGNDYKTRQKLYAYAIGRGYESIIINEVLNDLLSK